MSTRTKLSIFTIFCAGSLAYSFFIPDEDNLSKVRKPSQVNMDINFLGEICFPQYNPSDGELVFKQIQQKYKDCDLSLITAPIKNSTYLLMPVPIDEYNILSLEEKRKLINYLSSIIPNVKRYPQSYSIIPPDAPIHKTNLLSKYIEAMNYQSCAFAIGPIVKGYYYQTGSGKRVYGKYIAEKKYIYYYDLEKTPSIIEK